MHPSATSVALWLLKIGNDGDIDFNPLSGLETEENPPPVGLPAAFSAETTEAAPVPISPTVTATDITATDHSTAFYIETPSATGASGLPAAPSALAVTPQAGYLEIEWTNNANNQNGFIIYRSDNDELHFRRWLEVWEPSMRGIADFSYSPGTTYYYKAQAFNENGYSQFSNIASGVGQ